MHLYVRKTLGVRKDGSPNWGLIKVTHANGKAIQQRVPQHEYTDLGFPPSLTIEEARERSKSLNAQATLLSRAKVRLAVSKRLDDEELLESAYLTRGDAVEFEQKVLLERMSPEDAKAKKLLSHWRACKRAILVVSLDVSEWSEKPYQFYDYWTRENVSMSYVKKLIPLLNKWGMFQAKKYKTAFLALPFPTGIESEKIKDGYLDAFTRLNASDPIKPSQLEAKRNNFKPEHWNWIYLSVWFGLRPKEIDSLKKPQSPTSWSISTNNHGVEILYVYQSKLKGIDREKRVKHIPCFSPEQLAGLKIIEAGNFKRPLVKTLKKYFTPFTNCYGGRKGFTNLMLGRGHSFVDVSKWMGHKNLDRTYGTYMDHQDVDAYKKAS